MRVGMIGLGNIGGHVAPNLVADGHEVTVYDLDAERVAAIDGRRGGGVGRGGGRGGRDHDAVAADAGGRPPWPTSGRRRAAGLDPRRPLHQQPRRWCRELGARLAATGHHLVEAPLTGGALGAEKRMLVFMVGGDDDAVARVRRCSSRSAAPRSTSAPLGLGNTMKLVNSLIAFTATWVSLEGLSMCAKAGIAVQQRSRCSAPAAVATSSSTAWSRGSTSAAGRPSSRSSWPRRTWA